MVYRMFFLGRNFVYGLKPKKPTKPKKHFKNFKNLKPTERIYTSFKT